MTLTEFFSVQPKVIQPFKLFGRSHFAALLCLFLFIFICTVLSRNNDKIRSKYKMFLLIALPTQEIMYKIWAGIINGVDFKVIFSLHICSISIFLLIFTLIKYKQNIFEILYFWGLGGATQALLTPDIYVYGFPHFRFFQVFFSHGMIIATVIYFMFAERKKIRKGALKRVFVFTNLYGLIVFGLNFIFGTNYMFLNHKPETASILDALGPWPLYLIWMEVIMLIIFSLLYLPVYLRRRKMEKIAISLSSN